ncbi:MAG: nucleotidyltransferase domain-containing protein [Actinobacteria bacterium]|nr:nucleotidyltransferase domain-containing protein [Actinomycetota bacterium]
MPGKDSGIRAQASVDAATVAAFAEALRKAVRLSSMVVFGSRATGDNLEDSDYDILVLSPDFERYDRVERIVFLLESWPGAVCLEPVAMTPDEFEAADGALVWDILDEGLVIVDDGTFERKRFRHLERVGSGELRKEEGFWVFS